MGALLAGRGRRRRADRGRARARPAAGRRRARAPRHAVPRRALRGPDAHRGRPEGARVQRPLRRSGDAGGAPAPEERPARPVRARDAARRAGGRRARVGRARGVTVVLASRGYPASSSSRRRDHAGSRMLPPRSPTRARPRDDGADRHRRRPRAQRDRARRRPRSRPRGRICCRRRDHLRLARPTARDIAA